MDIVMIPFDDFHGRKKGSIGSSVIRCHWLVDAWPELKAFKQGMKADVMIYQKVYWKWHMRDFDGIKIVDLADPDWLNGDLDLIEVSNMVDAFTCSSEGLTKIVSQIVKKPVYYIPDRVNMNMFSPKAMHKGRAKKLVWFGYRHNAVQIIPKILGSLAKLNIDLHIVSDNDLNIDNDMGVDITFSKYETETAYDIIKQSDICLNPKMNQGKFKFKSDNKTVIAWALGLPVATNMDELEKFMDEKARTEEVAKRTKEIESKWEIKHSVNEYLKVIEDVKKTRANKS